MKSLKQIIIVLSIFSFAYSHAQNVNLLTKNEYSNLLISGVNWKIIKETKGNLEKLNSFFGNDLSINIIEEPSLGKEIKNRSLYFYFEDKSDTGNEFELVSFNIESNLASLTIKDKKITIGNNISKLGNVMIITSKDGNKKIVFGTNWTHDGLWIEFDQVTNVITKIEYMLYD